MKLALIIGSQGQDGTFLWNYLVKKKYAILGIDKNKIRCTHSILNKNKIDISDIKKVMKLVKKLKPREIYYLAAYHHSSEDNVNNNIDLLVNSYKVNVLYYSYFLEAIRKYSKKTRIFYASSSLIFGNPEPEVQNEDCPIQPLNIYGMTKANGIIISRIYRNNYNIFACCGILYNHESHLRSPKFVSMKIIKSALSIKEGKSKKLRLGDLSAEVDWGYAPDFIVAMHKILQIKNPDDFIIATGVKRTVKDYVICTFEELGLDWKKYVSENKTILRRENKKLIGDYTKLNKVTGWKPSVSFEDMIKIIIENLKKNK